MPQVKVLLKGRFRWIKKDHCLARCTTTLIQATGRNIIIDPGNAVGAVKLRRALQKLKLKPPNIDLVVNTHSHSDHAGANFLFPRALVIAADSAQRGEEYVFYKSLQPLWLAQDVWLVATPGHTAEDVSVLVKTPRGVVAIVGDLFWFKQNDKLTWAEDRQKLKTSQKKIIKLADYIIPGHGTMFKVKK